MTNKIKLEKLKMDQEILYEELKSYKCIFDELNRIEGQMERVEAMRLRIDLLNKVSVSNMKLNKVSTKIKKLESVSEE